ncbi:MAG: hypothetical protein INH34_12390 [Phycisphaerales bacterium]|jgi:hypothetical protein|nr:hypothetical protein [Phycisphaerales bacterium]
MDPTYYKLIHVVGALLLFCGLGGMLAGKGGKLAGMLHGIGLLAMLVAGIGFAHKSGYGWPGWLLAKIGVWVLLGALPFLVKRGILGALGALVLALGLGATAVWLAQAKPF